MSFYEKTKVLPFSCSDLHSLVWAVDQYPHFLPGVLSANVYNKTEKSFDSDLTVGSSFFSIIYTSHVTSTHHPYTIDTVCIKGPLALKSSWTFTPCSLLQFHTHVHFQVTFSFHNKTLEKMLEKTFTTLVDRMMSAFEKRAHVLFGKTLG